jgi:hypothetical protein
MKFTKILMPKSLKKIIKKKKHTHTRVFWEFQQDLTENPNGWVKLKEN